MLTAVMIGNTAEARTVSKPVQTKATQVRSKKPPPTTTIRPEIKKPSRVNRKANLTSQRRKLK